MKIPLNQELHQAFRQLSFPTNMYLPCLLYTSFRENWKVEFIVPKNSETFRDLISEDVHLSLDDNGSIGVLDKGAGLQKLATILLNFEIDVYKRQDCGRNEFFHRLP